MKEKRKRMMSDEGVLAVVTDQILRENKSNLRKLTKKQIQQLKNNKLNQSDSSIEIIEKKSPLKCQKKIKVTKEALERFIKRTFIVISDDEASVNYNGNKKNQTQIQVNNESISRSSSILSSSSSSSILQQYEKSEKKGKQFQNYGQRSDFV
ncbi:unnamed protein product [Paramecium sonneborni]|uniref:Uncharacterized protein n=1 Tax=Paramecium sonneborni TaxID=65129 RepID=A0A8S1MAM5_9CILI|nr:unnamed protein product [Paramecium sonneborni]